MRLLLAFVSVWFPLTSVPSVAHVEWRCGTRGEQVAVRLTPPVATTVVYFEGRRRTLNGGGFVTPWQHGVVRVRLVQTTEARTLDATLTMYFDRGGYCEPYLPPPFTLRVRRL
ncbi:MAG TPA: hypothetical protein VFC33_15640 [Acidimicrobiia bacterium]|nr:hypothetical protein [Acidimicrobiia bacterium]